MGLAVSLLLKNFGIFNASHHIALLGLPEADQSKILHFWQAQLSGGQLASSSSQPQSVCDGCSMAQLTIGDVVLNVWDVASSQRSTLLPRLANASAIVCEYCCCAMSGSIESAHLLLPLDAV
eukprot:m.103251 g.103251  ORF g.103251 m.103251 type:complete len:122 (-) comp14143_c0_seq3:689-1054(-)